MREIDIDAHIHASGTGFLASILLRQPDGRHAAQTYGPWPTPQAAKQAILDLWPTADVTES